MSEHERVGALLAGTAMTFSELPLDDGGRRFVTAEGDVEADVYVVDAEPEAAAARLRTDAGDLASHNGLIVFRVRYTGPPDAAAAGAIRVGTVAGALAGEE